MTKALAIVAALLLASTSALGWALYNQIQANGTLQAQIDTLTTDLEAERRAAKRNADEALSNYEASSRACQRAIRSAVAAIQIKPIEVPRYDENGAPNPACPAISLRDIQTAGTADRMPSSPSSRSAAGADRPR